MVFKIPGNLVIFQVSATTMCLGLDLKRTYFAGIDTWTCIELRFNDINHPKTVTEEATVRGRTYTLYTIDYPYHIDPDSDYYNSSTLFHWRCEKRKFIGIPCLVAVHLDEGAHAVIGFISTTTPETLSKEEDAAVRAKMPDPKKKGSFGYIDQVMVSRDFRGRGIGSILVELSIELARGFAGVIGMTVAVPHGLKEEVALDKKLGFLNVLSKLGYEEDLELYALYF
ncbi:hypothetical protein FOL47_011320 [Perkinsus chesapeaki]|uniref:N-acetyltransferase domain-containing protein n=1 Tax=Perkinsus chesapeaki TaxID=330153 RepID=A0A7J6MMK2_PERCH|nr:hypothetical protein FOL47_011320 [Perkinsus chesapeaki]